MYTALRAQRRELDQQLNQLEERRDDLARELQQPQVEGVARKGLEDRMAEVDKRITSLEAQIATSDQAIANAAAVPGAVIEKRPEPRDGPPEEAFVAMSVFAGISAVILSLAFARRIWKRSSVIAPTLPPELWQRLTRLEEGVDSVAMEVERIGEGQRFTNKLFAENRGLASGAAQPIEVKAGEALRAPRSEY